MTTLTLCALIMAAVGMGFVHQRRNPAVQLPSGRRVLSWRLQKYDGAAIRGTERRSAD